MTGVILALVAALIAGGFAGVVLGSSGKRDKKPKPRNFALVYDGELLHLQECQIDPGGITPTGDGDLGTDYVIPEGAILRAMKLDPLTTLHIAGIERVALKTHEQLDSYRQAVLARSVPAFSAGGDGAKMLKLVATLLPAVVILWLAFQVISLQSTQTDLVAQLNQLNDLLANGVRLAE